MIGLQTMRGIEYLAELQEGLESISLEDEDLVGIISERGKIMKELTDQSPELMSDPLIMNGSRGISFSKPPRVTRIYFDDVDESQGKAYGMKNDNGVWYLNTWSDNLSVTKMDNYLTSKSIPFKVKKFRMYGGK